MSVLDYFDEAYDYQIEPQQRLMLESLILPAPLDKESFSRWLVGIDLDAMDYPTLRLCSPLLKKFGGALEQTPCYERLKGIYRYFQLRNTLIASAGRRALIAMLDAGIDVVLFKGIAISLKYHRNMAIRPMADMDVLIRRETLPQAEELLRQYGYQYHYPEEKKSTDVHSHDYINADYSGFDLHWYSLYESPHAGIDDGIWERAEFLDWDGLVVKVMSPEDLLLTSIVNGVRDYPIRPHWIHDVATIVDSEPVLPWAKVWEEARKRHLREQVFIGLNLVRGISKETIPEAVLENVLENDLEFYRHLLKLAIAEGQTHESINAKIDEIEAVLSPADNDSRSFASDRVNLSGATLSGAPRRIRYFLDENKAIKGLFLKWRHLPLLAELFDVSDRQVLNDLVANHPSQGRGHLAVPPGLLATKLQPTLQTYGARIGVVDAPPSLILLAGQIEELTVEVENNTDCCWPVVDGSLAAFGLSYHLLSEDGKVLMWDTPRSDLFNPRISHVSFIEPAQILACKLKVVAPSGPGRYIVQLDLVHESVRWFAQELHQFPRIDLEVMPNERLDYYAVNGPDIVHENIDDETVIINARKGAYYTANGYASLIWSAIVDGYGESKIVSAFAAAAIFPADEKVVERFINSLVAERLITPAETGESGRRGDFRVDARFGTQVPVLTRHPGPRELIAMDPVRGASKQEGWPHPPVAYTGATGSAATETLSGLGGFSLFDHYYQAILGRAPDAAGKAYWEGEIARMQSLGIDVKEAYMLMAGCLFDGAEYLDRNTSDAQYVADLYNAFFNRAPDAGGLSYWTSQIAAGVPRSIVMCSFLFSPEFNSFMTGLFGHTSSRAEVYAVLDFYRGILNRLPDTAGFNNWLTKFREAQCAGAGSVSSAFDQISSSFIYSAEYLGRNRSNTDYVSDLYCAFLRRGGDLADVSYWINQLTSGVETREQLRKNFINTPELNGRVNAIIAQGSYAAPSFGQLLRALESPRWKKALSDIAEGWRRRELWETMALQDIRQRYQRSIIGPFWITLSMGVMIGALGLLYGTIFKQDIHDYMPFLAAGFVLWGLISSLIIEGTRVFTGVERLIRQLPAPLTVYVYRLLWSNLITFAHNALIFVLVCLWYDLNPGWTALLALPALLVLLLNGFWMALLLGLLSARFRDIPLVVASVMQVLFFITPIIWKPDMLPGRAPMLDLNPFHHFIEILRAPLLGHAPSLENWVAVIIVTFVGWAVALWFFSAYRWRLAYWV